MHYLFIESRNKGEELEEELDDELDDTLDPPEASDGDTPDGEPSKDEAAAQ